MSSICFLASFLNNIQKGRNMSSGTQRYYFFAEQMSSFSVSLGTLMNAFLLLCTGWQDWFYCKVALAVIELLVVTGLCFPHTGLHFCHYCDVAFISFPADERERFKSFLVVKNMLSPYSDIIQGQPRDMQSLLGFATYFLEEEKVSVALSKQQEQWGWPSSCINFCSLRQVDCISNSADCQTGRSVKSPVMEPKLKHPCQILIQPLFEHIQWRKDLLLWVSVGQLFFTARDFSNIQSYLPSCNLYLLFYMLNLKY